MNNSLLSLYKPVSSADQHVIGVIRWEPPFICVSFSWAHNTSRRLDSDHWRHRVTPLMPAITAPHTTTTIFFFFPTTNFPASHQLHTSHSGVGIQTLVRVRVTESKEGARGGGRIRHTSRFSRQMQLNSPKISKNTNKNKPGFKRLTWAQTLHLNTSWISSS